MYMAALLGCGQSGGGAREFGSRLHAMTSTASY
jgi:hypothetical protein